MKENKSSVFKFHNALTLRVAMLKEQAKLTSTDIYKSKPSSSINKKIVRKKFEWKPTRLKHKTNTSGLSFKGLPEYPSANELQKLRSQVDDAVRLRRTFTLFGNYYSVRKALLNRGWVERFNFNKKFADMTKEMNVYMRLHGMKIHDLMARIHDKEHGELYRQVVCSKLMGLQPVGLCWNLNPTAYRNSPKLYEHSLVNFIEKNHYNFTTKAGLSFTIANSNWYIKPDVCDLLMPRSHVLIEDVDKAQFTDDFKATAAMSFLEHIARKGERGSALVSSSGRVNISSFFFAIQVCKNWIKKIHHIDIDQTICDAPETRWNTFFEDFNRAVNLECTFREDAVKNSKEIFTQAKAITAKLKEFGLYSETDGVLNIWILKPCVGSCGNGIHICTTLKEIFNITRCNRRSYVAQKYIEHPMLIHGTKFDIRQWFLISCTSPLTIWIWKHCYIRFSSQPYNLKRLHESIHLTNNAVQSRYSNSPKNRNLPECNMWDLEDFRRYLWDTDRKNLFDEEIFPKMKQNILAAVVMNEEHIVPNKKQFELYGADFMIAEDYKVYLIEINAKPALLPSTPVTAVLCPEVIEDVIKVVIDLPKNARALTGKFELLYVDKNTEVPRKVDRTMQIKGHGMKHEPDDSHVGYLNSNSYIKYICDEMKMSAKALKKSGRVH